jgi:hypothetical protein
MSESLRVNLGMIVALACLSFVSLSVACSSSTPERETATPGVDAGASSSSSGSVSTGPASAYATELCARVERCFPGTVANSWGDAATCAHNFDELIGPQKTLAGSGMTDATLATCAEKFKTADCSLVQAEIPECLFKGTLKPGADCNVGIQCDSGVCIYESQTAVCGKCVATVAVGADCTNAECAPPSFCDSPGTNKCIDAPLEGGDCTNTDCGGGFACVSNKCVKAIPKDGACTVPASPADNPCVKGYTCIDGKCGLVAVTQKTGEACDPPHTGCIDGACLDTQCVANLKEGQSCDPSQEIPPFCEAPLACIGGKCINYVPTECK